jgi:hypothetical protein
METHGHKLTLIFFQNKESRLNWDGSVTCLSEFFELYLSMYFLAMFPFSNQFQSNFSISTDTNDLKNKLNSVPKMQQMRFLPKYYTTIGFICELLNLNDCIRICSVDITMC